MSTVTGGDVLNAAIHAAENALRARIALDAAAPEAVRRAAAARLLRRAQKMFGGEAAKVLPALRALESLALIERGEIASLWAALRGAAVSVDAEILVSAEMAVDPIANTMARAFGATLVASSRRPAFVIAKGDVSPATLIAAATRPHNHAAARDSEGKLTYTTVAIVGDTVTVATGAAESKSGDKTADKTAEKTGDAVAIDMAADADAIETAICAARELRQNHGRHIGPLTVANGAAKTRIIENDATFTPYELSRIVIAGAKIHPTPIVESVALASVTTPAITVTPMVNLDAVRKGAISDIQLEAITCAIQAHSSHLRRDPLAPLVDPARRGFLIGHGTGVGKGRIIAGVIADSWVQGRKRHIWISESARLIEDAMGDWTAMGGKKADIIDIRDFPSNGVLPASNGILFMTYAALRAEHGGAERWRQAATWFAEDGDADGVLAFDEAQNLRNALGGENAAHLSHQGKCSLMMQRLLPQARVLYVSATSASDLPSMGFAERLGVWGPGTAFKTMDAFANAMRKGGVNALEMVARDMKAMGVYLAGNLSFEGAEYRRMPIALSPKARAIQDRSSQTWATLISELKAAQQRTGLLSALAFVQNTLAGLKKGSGVTVNTRYAQKFSLAQIRMERARFFQALLASLKIPAVIEEIEQDIERGDAAIIQISNTFAATAERAMDDTEDPQDIDATPRDIMLAYLENHFPVIKTTTVMKGIHLHVVPLLNPITGDPEICKVSVAARNRLRRMINDLDLPDGPLEQLYAAFPADWIAEATGRMRRLVKEPSGARRIDVRETADVAREIHEFMDDRRKILVFSAAGAVGATYSAALTARNQRMRRHYVLQPGWRADMAVQGMGRSHRSNQRQAPEYILPMTDLWADLRMVSRIASKMRALGALTRGMRSAASQGFFTDLENFENEFASKAWRAFLNKVEKREIPGMTLRSLENETALSLLDINGGLMSEKAAPEVSQFLNALSAMTFENQEIFGRNFSEVLDELRITAIRMGEYDRGIECIEADALIKTADTVIYSDPHTGAETRLVDILEIHTTEPTSFVDAEAMVARRGSVRAAQNYMNGRVMLLALPVLPRFRAPAHDDAVLLVTPTGPKETTRGEVTRLGLRSISLDEAEAIWEAEILENGASQEQTLQMVTGAMLPIWDKLPESRSQVVRLTTDAGESILGRLISKEHAQKLMENLSTLQAGGIGFEEVLAATMGEAIIDLANGWTIRSRKSWSSRKRESHLFMSTEDYRHYSAMIAAIEGVPERYALTTKDTEIRLPDDDDKLAAAITKVLSITPAMSIAA